MHLAILIVALICAVVVGGALARRLGVPSPLLLVVVGAIASPFVHVELNEEVVLVGILPPLLYAAAQQTSLLDFRSNIRPIALLSVGLVIFTTVCIGFLLWWIIPGLPLAAAFAIGAVVAPPDAVAATAIGKRVGLPRQLTTILEGESLVNDATALVLLRTSVAAIGGSITAWQVGVGFLVSALGGLVVGLVIALILKKVRKRVTNPVTDASIALVIPFIAYIAGEELHIGGFGASGVLAVVVVGLVMGHVAPVIQTPQSRVFERTIWMTIQAVLEDLVFLLIGLDLWIILSDVRDSDLPLGRIVLGCVAVLVAVVALRPIWIFPATRISRMVPGAARRGPVPQWQNSAVLSWAGMRGVVTLAAALTLPAQTPHREVLLLFALVVTGGTLLLQGSTLPWLVRRLRLAGADPAEDVLTEAELLQRVVAVGVARLDELDGEEGDEPIIASLKERSEGRANSAWELLGDPHSKTPSQRYGELLVAQLEAERGEVLRVRDTGEVPHEVIQHVLRQLDVEESLVAANLDRALPKRSQELTASTKDACVHLAAAQHAPRPLAQVCQTCVDDDEQWVHLRLCMECGFVGCCDSSEGKHASAHYHDTGHPVMRSFELGEGWRWCFVDDQLG